MKKIVLLLILISGYFAVKIKLDRAVTTRKARIDIRYIPSPRMARLLSLGYEPAVADLYWIEGINYFGWQLAQKNRSYTFLPAYMDLISRLDPYFSAFYEWGSTAYIYNGLHVDRDAIIHAMEIVNAGIRNLHEVYRAEPKMIEKAAFNYALEARQYLASIPYFQLVARTFPDRRDLLLVASSYAGYANRPELASALKMEYLGYLSFEAQNKSSMVQALQIVSSPHFNSQAAEFVRGLRLQMEKDEEIKKIVAKRLQENPILERSMASNENIGSDHRLQNLLNIDFSRTWMPADLHVLFSL